MTTRVCPKCDTEKLISDFPIDKGRPSGRHPYCKTCKARMMREANKRWRERHPEAAKRSTKAAHLKKTFGITIEQYEDLLAKQGGQCLICKTSPDPFSLAVDHCHQTNKIRGLLCRSCNQGLGHFKDDPDLLRSALRYLRRPGTGKMIQRELR